jgi:hypothetical protein
MLLKTLFISCKPFSLNAFSIDSAILPPPITQSLEHNDDVTGTEVHSDDLTIIDDDNGILSDRVSMFFNIFNRP